MSPCGDSDEWPKPLSSSVLCPQDGLRDGRKQRIPTKKAVTKDMAPPFVALRTDFWHQVEAFRRPQTPFGEAGRDCGVGD